MKRTKVFEMNLKRTKYAPGRKCSTHLLSLFIIIVVVVAVVIIVITSIFSGEIIKDKYCGHSLFSSLIHTM